MVLSPNSSIFSPLLKFLISFVYKAYVKSSVPWSTWVVIARKLRYLGFAAFLCETSTHILKDSIIEYYCNSLLYIIGANLVLWFSLSLVSGFT